MSGAEYLASIYGTEKDKVNFCSIFFFILKESRLKVLLSVIDKCH